MRNEPALGEGALLEVSPTRDRLVRRDRRPFFWLGDTAWLINAKLTKDEMVDYLDVRAGQGYTVVQVMALHTPSVANSHGNPAFSGDIDADLSRGFLATGAVAGEGYWDTLDFLFEAAASRGIYIALVPVWGTMIQEELLSLDQAVGYTRLLARRYGRHANLIWLNGGDIRGSDHRQVWEALGEVLRQECPLHPITFHPFGRTRSSTWFHDSPWLDFHMVQSGHRNYDQRTPDTEVAGEDVWYGEDNWRYLLADRALPRAKPTLDGEPSYEDIPHGLHDLTQPRWNDADCRRYAWWALLAGAFGHTYGHNSVMQFQREGDAPGAYGATRGWQDCLGDPGARQMTFVRLLMEALGSLPLEPVTGLVASEARERYQHQRAARAGDRLVVYAYSGGTIDFLSPVGDFQSRWFDPRTGAVTLAQSVSTEPPRFRCPGDEVPGNDWLLLLEPQARPSLFP